MKKRSLAIAASILLVAALAVIVAALANEQPIVWGIGLIAVALAMIMSLFTRWVGRWPE